MRRHASRLCPCLLMLLSACQPAKTVRIGVVLDSDGVRGAELAAADVNAAGGINGRPLQLRVISGLSSTSAKDALSAADSLAKDPTVLAVVGHTNSAASLAAAQVYNDYHLVQMAPTTTAPLYSDAGSYSFRLVASDVHQGALLADIVAHDSTRPRTAVLYVNDDYGRALHATTSGNLATAGVHAVYDAPYEEGARFTHAPAIASELARSHAQLLVWIGRSAELRRLLPELRKSVPGIRILASDGFSGPAPTAAPDSTFVGVRYVRFLDPRTLTPASRHLSDYYREHWHHEATDQYSLSYDAVRVLAEGLKHGDGTREGVRTYLFTLGHGRPPYQGATRDIAFDELGDVTPLYLLGEVTPTGTVVVPLSWEHVRQQ